MPIANQPTIQEILIDAVTREELLSGKLSNLDCKNYSSNGFREGALSLVFKGEHVIEDEAVAVKFFDPSFNQDIYRLRAFLREVEILERINSANPKALKIIDPIEDYTFEVTLKGGSLLPQSTKFFVTEWLENDVKEEFHSDNVSTIEKLNMFRKIILSVQYLHRKDVFHRDIKIDNIRLRKTGNINECVIIDFGTAATIDSENIVHISQYDKAVGAGGYAPPEAVFGLSGERGLCKSADIYSLGCLLFEMFNSVFFYQVREASILNFLHYHKEMTELNNNASRLARWHEILKSENTINLINYKDYFISVPSAIKQNLINIQKSMTQFDYTKRERSLESILKKIDILIKVNGNELAYQKRLELKKKRRANSIAKVLERDKKIALYKERITNNVR